MDQETMTVDAMLDVSIAGHTFRLTRVEARRLRDLLTDALHEQPSWPVVDAWPPTVPPVLPPVLPPSTGTAPPWRGDIYCGDGAR
mgnify:CR=1 FL=1